MASEFPKPNNEEINYKSHKIANPNRHPNNPKTIKESIKKPDPVPRTFPVDVDIYHATREENIKLKKRVQELEELLKKLKVLLRSKSETSFPDANANENNKVKYDFPTVIDDTGKAENDRLISKNKKMRTIIAGLQSELNKKGSRQTKGYLPNSHETSDYLKGIAHLQQSLNEAHEDRKKGISDLTENKESRASSIITCYSDDLRDKSGQVSELKDKYNRGQIQMETTTKVLNLTKQSLDEYMNKYKEERDKTLELELEIEKQKTDLEKTDEYLSIIEEYKKKEAQLEENIVALSENPFINQGNEQSKAFAKLNEKEIALEKAMSKGQDLELKNKDLEEKLASMTTQYEECWKERNQFMEDGMKYKAAKEEREKLVGELLSRLGQDGEVNSSYLNMAGILKGKLPSIDGQGSEWENINFLEKRENAMKILSEENERLKIEKGLLGKEGNQTKFLLHIQQKINEDYKIIQAQDNKKFMLENRKLKDKIRQLLPLVNKDDLSVSSSISSYDPNRTDTSKFSKFTNESIFMANDNSVDLYFGDAYLEPTVVTSCLNIDALKLFSFISVDFYLHDTQVSDVMKGPYPNYNFQLSFRVKETEHFITYGTKESIVIELYYVQSQEEKKIIATGLIELNQLIKAESNPKSRVIRSKMKLCGSGKQGTKIGYVEYKMRMRKSIATLLKDLDDKHRLENELSAVNQINNSIIGKFNSCEDKKGPATLKDDNTYAYDIKITVRKAENINLSNDINPYLFYKFYDRYTRFSNIIAGNNPIFDDIAEFNGVVYDTQFHDYIEKESGMVYVFNFSNPISDMNDEIEGNNPEKQDGIGCCEIKGRSLGMNNTIEGKFPIKAQDGNVTIGEGDLTITWEQKRRRDSFMDSVQSVIKAANNDEGVEPLLIEFAKYGRNEKKLNLNSAFHILDRDNHGVISIADLKCDVTFGFTTDLEKINKLTTLIFKGKAKMEKNEFYKVFKGGLPFEGDVSPEKEIINNNNNNNVEEKHDDIAMSRRADQTKLNEQIIGGTQNCSIEMSSSLGKRTGGNKRSVVYAPDYEGRTIPEMIKVMQECMIKHGKISPSEVFSLFNTDTVDKLEMVNCLKKIDMRLSPPEWEMMWGEIVKEGETSFDEDDFINFYKRNDYNDRK